MPRLVRLYLVSILIGLALSVLFVGLLLVLDVAGLRHLILDSMSGWLAGLMLVIFNTIVFSGVQFGIAVMRLAESAPPPGGHRGRAGWQMPARQKSPAVSRRVR